MIGRNTFPTRYGAFWSTVIPPLCRVNPLYRNLRGLCRFCDAAPPVYIRQKRDWLLYL
ncbi:hypothetical protein FEK41_01200 [Escherichia sp. E4694]|nr:hypothetical protein D9740_12280 [Escherichia sp. E14V5]RZN02313.1 hypothetical protein D9741_14535 [Escherichia sp. E14V7]RZN29119.1 hypothetical protein D9739_02880 [Escherichia sp. E14V10]TLJ02251.1 hypothetical protein FEK41_01200 [Escherichia sp. E4694]